MKSTIVKLKFVIATACLILAGIGVYHAVVQDTKPAKYYMVELETKVRPARFEDLKFQLQPSVDVRAPASSTDH